MLFVGFGFADTLFFFGFVFQLSFVCSIFFFFSFFVDFFFTLEKKKK